MSIGARRATELMDQHGISPRKSLGQNFIVDPNTIDRIVRLAEVAENDHVIEIGPGIGSMTVALAETGAAVTAIEIDGSLLGALRDHVGDRSVTIVHGDAAEVDWSEILGGPPAADSRTVKLVANLPYNVGTPLLLDTLHDVPQISEFTVMVQLEVAERLAAKPDTPEYGIPSVKVAWWGSAEVVARIPRSVFIPRPNVDSAIVRIVREAPPATDVDVDAVFSLVQTGFGQRRKMVRKSLGGLITEAMFEAAGVKPTARPQELGVEQWCELARVVAAR